MTQIFVLCEKNIIHFMGKYSLARSLEILGKVAVKKFSCANGNKIEPR
jgi:hypothetical protein